MSEPFIGEIRMFAGNFAPRGWAFCDGQLVAISQNDALFSLFGTIYGGDGRTTFALPDLRGRLPVHQGQGPSLPQWRMGQRAGAETVTLSAGELPAHQHGLQASTDTADAIEPNDRVTADAATTNIYGKGTPGVALNDQALAASGGGQPLNNLMPYLCVHFIVAQQGIYPSRN